MANKTVNLIFTIAKYVLAALAGYFGGTEIL